MVLSDMKNYLAALRQHIFNIRRYVFDPLNEGQILSRLRDYFKWHLGYKYRGKQWIVTFDNGMRSIVYPFPDHDAGEVDIWTRNNDLLETVFIRQFLNQEDRIYDIGCNVGNRTWVLADCIAGAVLIDAGEQAVRRATENRDLNGLPPADFEVVLTAVGADVGHAFFSDFGGASTLNKILDEDLVTSKVQRCKVPVTTLDVEVRKRNWIPAFIKIDAEGHDLEVLKGAITTLKSGYVKYVKFERLSSVSLKSFEDFWAELGWTIFALDESGMPTRNPSRIEASPNLFARQSDEFEASRR
jgi:FkbM family methyltransferase